MHKPAHLVLLLTTALLAVGCTTQQQGQAGTAATTPLADLNLVTAPIPEVLRAAAKAPYAMPADTACTALAADIRALDEVLGLDVDAPPSDKRPSLVERGAEVVGDDVVGNVRRTAEGIVPFRSWIRRLTGAERYTRQVNAAITAGTARRAFLKGLGAARACG